MLASPQGLKGADNLLKRKSIRVVKIEFSNVDMLLLCQIPVEGVLTDIHKPLVVLHIIAFTLLPFVSHLVLL